VPVPQPLLYTSGLPVIQPGLDLVFKLVVRAIEMLFVGCVRSEKPVEIEIINVRGTIQVDLTVTKYQ